MYHKNISYMLSTAVMLKIMEMNQDQSELKYAIFVCWRVAFALQICNLVIKVVIIFLINQIWKVRNDIKYKNKKISIIDSINMINMKVKIPGDNTSYSSFISVNDFSSIKVFGVNIRPHIAPNIRKVLWCPPNPDCTKCNFDEAFNTYSNTACAGRIFRNHLENFILVFVENIKPISFFFCWSCIRY